MHAGPWGESSVIQVAAVRATLVGPARAVCANLRAVRLVAFAALALACGLASACQRFSLQADTRARYEAVVRVSEGGKPVKGARILNHGTVVGTTVDDGSAAMRFVGAEGELYDLAVECPEGLRSPQKPVRITLRRLEGPAARPEYAVQCTRALQTVVVAVRAENGANLPVYHLGKEVARTDASGAAHVALRLPPEDTFELKLGTDTAADGLRPQNPTASFVVKARDDVLLFDQRFTVDKKKVKAGPRKGPTKL